MNAMKIVRQAVQGVIGAAVVVLAQGALGADGTWTNLAGGAWSTAGNWLSGTVAGGTDAIADFSTLNLTANAVVDNDVPSTVGTLRFGDTTPGNDWTLQNAALTLAVSSGTPTIDVANQTATISSVLQGTQGFVKQGSGTLWINGKSTMAGDITVSQGMLGNTLGGLRNTSGSVIVSAGATLYATSGWGDGDSHAMTNSITLSGTGMNAGIGALHGQANFDCNGPITLLTDSKITHDWNYFILNSSITGDGKNLGLAITAGGQPPMVVNSSVNLGTGILTVDSVDGSDTAGGDPSVDLNAANTYSGGTVLTNYGTLRLGNPNALGSGGVTLYQNGQVNLNTRNISIAWLSGLGGSITDHSGAGTTTLTVDQSTNTTYSGVIRDGASRVVAVTKTGSGTLTLAGGNTYSGATTITGGKLTVGVGAVSWATASAYTFSPASSNLLAGLSPTLTSNAGAGAEGTGPVTLLADGNTDAPYTVGNNAVLTYTLAPANQGSNITKINIYTGWANSDRENISLAGISYSTVAAPDTFIAIPNSAVNYEGGTSAAFASLTASGGAFALNVYAIRFNFGAQEYGYVGYKELEVCTGEVLTQYSGALPNSTNVNLTASGAVLELAHADCLSTNTEVHMVTGSAINLTGTSKVRMLYINGEPLPHGLYSEGSPATAGYLSGTGLLDVFGIRLPGTLIRIF